MSYDIVDNVKAGEKKGFIIHLFCLIRHTVNTCGISHGSPGSSPKPSRSLPGRVLEWSSRRMGGRERWEILQAKAARQIYKVMVAIGKNVARIGQDRKLVGKICLRVARPRCCHLFKRKKKYGGGGGGRFSTTDVYIAFAHRTPVVGVRKLVHGVA